MLSLAARLSQWLLVAHGSLRWRAEWLDVVVSCTRTIATGHMAMRVQQEAGWIGIYKRGEARRRVAYFGHPRVSTWWTASSAVARVRVRG